MPKDVRSYPFCERQETEDREVGGGGWHRKMHPERESCYSRWIEKDGAQGLQGAWIQGAGDCPQGCPALHLGFPPGSLSRSGKTL